MIHSFFPEKDSTIYEYMPDKNTGLDEILELQKQKYASRTASIGPEAPKDYESRILIKFKTSEISSFLTDNNINIDSASFVLNLYVASQYEVPYEYTIEAYPVSGAWTTGTGRYDGSEITDGVTWASINGLTASLWDTGSVGKYWYNVNEGGGNWYTSPIASASFTQESEGDLQLTVTQHVKDWVNNTIPNHGFILKIESSSYILPSFPTANLAYYSNNTTTVYSPQLQIFWNTGSYSSSLSTMTFRDNPVVYLSNLKSEYKQNTKNRIYIGTRPKYPRPTFTQTNVYATTKVLPSSSYYRIVDAHTLEPIIDYNDYTKISADNSGSYFDFWTSPFYPERWYKFEFKIAYNDSTEYYVGNEYIFKVID